MGERLVAGIAAEKQVVSAVREVEQESARSDWNASESGEMPAAATQERGREDEMPAAASTCGTFENCEWEIFNQLPRGTELRLALLSPFICGLEQAFIGYRCSRRSRHVKD